MYPARLGSVSRICMKTIESSEMLFCESTLRPLVFMLFPSVGSVAIMRRIGVNSSGTAIV